MAEVHIIDIDGERWDIKDSPLTERVTTLEDIISVKSLPELDVTLKSEYSTTIMASNYHYSFGKIHFVSLQFKNLSGTNIGTYNQAIIASTNLRPKKRTTFFLFDFTNRAQMLCNFLQDGTIAISKSYGVKSGNNDCYGELIFAEE